MGIGGEREEKDSLPSRWVVACSVCVWKNCCQVPSRPRGPEIAYRQYFVLILPAVVGQKSESVTTIARPYTDRRRKNFDNNTVDNSTPALDYSARITHHTHFPSLLHIHVGAHAHIHTCMHIHPHTGSLSPFSSAVCTAIVQKARGILRSREVHVLGRRRDESPWATHHRGVEHHRPDM